MSIINKQVISGKQARESLLKGISLVADAVGTTLGPRGKNVVIGKQFSLPIVTKDGVSVAKAITVLDPVLEPGVEIIKHTAIKAEQISGDATTTTTILTKAFVEVGMKLMDEGHNPTTVKQLMRDFSEDVIDMVSTRYRNQVQSTEDRMKIAMVSTNGDKSLSEVIVDGFENAGKYGRVVVRQTGTSTDLQESINGYALERGIYNDYFFNEPNVGITDVSNPYLIVSFDEMDTLDQQEIEILQQLLMTDKKESVVILAANFTKDFVNQMIRINKNLREIRIILVRAPYYGEYQRYTMQDIAYVACANPLSVDFGVSLTDVSFAGRIRRLEGNKKGAVISFIDDKETKERIEQCSKTIYNQINYNHQDYDQFPQTKQKERLSRISSKTVYVDLAGETETELKERFDRAQDAIGALKAVGQGGYIIGGGVPLYVSSKAQRALKNKHLDIYDRFTEAFSYPLLKLCQNSDIDPKSIMDKINEVYNTEQSIDELNFGYNFATLSFDNLMESGIIEPFLSLSTSVRLAVSTAITVLDTSVLIVEQPESVI